jgi:hypothetical protein
LQGWLAGRESKNQEAFARMHFENMPVIVVESYRSGAVNGSALTGKFDEQAEKTLTAMRAAGQNYRQAVTQVSLAKESIRGLTASIASINARNDQKSIELDMNTVRNTGGILQGIGNIISGFASGGKIGLIGGIISAVSSAFTAVGTEYIGRVPLRAAQNAESAAEKDGAVSNTNAKLLEHMQASNDAMSSAYERVKDVNASLRRLVELRNALKSALEKAQGASAWNCQDVAGTDIVCRSYVNGVLNVRYSGTQLRYDNALLAARTSAFYAKRAVEQRIGARLETFTKPLGSLEAPAKWSDRLCEMRGVDFTGLLDEIKKQTVQDAAQNSAWQKLRSEEYANGFIGDYTQLLERFVDAYNVGYPFQDGTDTALISMRENVSRTTGDCDAPSINRLRSSDNLGGASDTASDDIGTWRLHLCTEPKCVESTQWLTPQVLGNTLFRPASAAWLRTRPKRLTDNPPEQGVVAPSGYISQKVALPAGSYALSFVDGSVAAATGEAVLTPSTPYRVSIFDESGAMLATQTNTPATGLPATIVTPTGQVAGTIPVFTTRLLRFSVPTNGAYRIAFAPNTTSNEDGSVLIATPQLERDDVGAAPTRYEPTSAEGTTRKTSCASSPGEFRAQFQRKCDVQRPNSPAPRCYYEQRRPFSLNSRRLTINGQPLGEIIAADNYNYRHIDFALNLVGGGVRNCDENPSPACQANGTIEYDLVHEANSVPIMGWDREEQRFSFGEGAIRYGKALSAERYLSVPLSAGDTGLLATTGVTKTELRGRPLDGRYRLRIYEAPALRWNRVEDVQLMLRYRYWSRVSGTQKP